MTLHETFQQVQASSASGKFSTSYVHSRVDFASFYGLKGRKHPIALSHIFKTTWDFQNQSKLENPEYLQLPLLGYHKPYEGVYKD